MNKDSKNDFHQLAVVSTCRSFIVGCIPRRRPPGESDSSLYLVFPVALSFRSPCRYLRHSANYYSIVCRSITSVGMSSSSSALHLVYLVRSFEYRSRQKRRNRCKDAWIIILRSAHQARLMRLNILRGVGYCYEIANSNKMTHNVSNRPLLVLFNSTSFHTFSYLIDSTSRDSMLNRS
jgi:hypothetical protein